ncbi:hypothetical protein TA5114_03257 [Cognatishimia activa]|uniref:DUF1330 domain-containing protein n=1 Tax=Cognatishimia activa TaxID=1715691 RepID=A0A0P1JCD2_9RHOB|nr:DUF1330 domain-containing protein [Cognatishimia activa]MEE2946025.1 DUF1330 domain-containing protein [Pseudomonadota bacterium]CUK27429.1 hypothetical protein TA5114_03257 [Cognatishimia activa]
MPKAYWVAHVTVTDPDRYKLYAEGTAAPFEKYGAKVLARGGTYHVLEGFDHPRNVVIEFPDLDTALACFNSPEYQAAREHRLGAGDVNITIVEGAS